MKKFLLGIALMAGFAAQAATITEPSADKYYRIKHTSGYYLTAQQSISFKIQEKDENDAAQVFRFEPVENKDGVYNVRNMMKLGFLGSDGAWTSVILSRNAGYSQYSVELASDNSDLITLVNAGMPSGKKCLGTDDTAAGSSVYTDKAGTDAKHRWTLEEADYTPAEPGDVEDVYAEYPLPEGDPRANAYEGYRLVFAEEFSGEGKPSDDIWNFEKGFKRNVENQYYDGNNMINIHYGVASIEGRNIEAEKRPNPAYDKYSKNWPSSLGKYLTWISGSMITKGGWDSGYSWLFGIFEVRAKVPQYVGCWPAIWSTGRQWSWPQGGEIDLLEYYGHAIHGNVCYGNTQWISKTVGDSALGQGWGDEYHIWRMYWEYDRIEMWCDDILVNCVDLDKTYNPVSEGKEWSGKNPFREVRNIIWLNLALGGNAGGSLANTPRPSWFLIDYARVYQKYGTDGKATYHVEEEISTPSFPWNNGQSGVDEVVADVAGNEVTGVYNLQGMRVADTLEGAENIKGQTLIVVRGNKSEKVVF